jgi:hypothetical protein
VASNLPVQVIADGSFAAPSDCVSRGGTNLGSVASLTANGVIGIGAGIRDMPGAAQSVLPATYYYCTSSGACTNTRVPLDTQVMTPVANFASDNNGTIVSLPGLSPNGQDIATGLLTCGVSTQKNNALPSAATIVPLDQNGLFTTVYKGRAFSFGAIDSGTNVYGVPDATIPVMSDWFTPSTLLSLSRR